MNAQPSITPRPIYRSKTLWAGILVLTFLAWAWWDSTRSETTFRIGSFTLTHAGSGISLAQWATGSALIDPTWCDRAPVPPRSIAWSQPNLTAPETFHHLGQSNQLFDYLKENPSDFTLAPRNAAAGHFVAILIRGTTGSRAIYIPHWLLITLFLIPWTALLLWRHHRTRRHLTKPIG